MKKQNITLKLKNMSKNSGVYKMLDRTGNVIYIGKAKNLKNRVSQYFIQSNQNSKMRALLQNIYDFSVIDTKTETQALLLENDSLRNQMGEQAQIEAGSRTWEITSREIALLYSNLVKSPNI